MTPIPLRIVSIFIIDCVLLVVGLMNLFSLPDRARIPFKAETQGERVTVVELLDAASCGELNQGDVVRSWNACRILNHEALEILGDLQQIGDKVHIDFQRGSESGRAAITLIQFYSTPRFMIVYGFLGVVMWCMGITVLLSRHEGLPASTLHWLMISLSTVVLLTQGPIEAGTIASAVKWSLFFASYVLVGALFAFFAMIFPREKTSGALVKVLLIFGPASALTFALIYYYIRAIHSLNGEDFLGFQQVNTVFHLAVAVYAGAGILNLFISYKKSELKEDRSRLQWILWGFAVGPAPFVLLIALPMVFGTTEVVPEEYASIFLLAAPLSLAVSLLRYRLFDIEVVINRSIVYALLTVFIGSIYVLTVLLLVSILGGEQVFAEYAFVVAVTLVLAFAINPLRILVQKFVDETLFPAHVNFGKVLTHINQEIQTALSSAHLFQILTESVHNVIPFNAVAAYSSAPGRLVRMDWRGDPLNQTLVLKPEHISLFTAARTFVTSTAVDFRREDVDTSKETFLKRFDCALCIPLLSESRYLLGILAARPSSRTGRFSEEEIDLLQTICGQAAEVLDRLKLQEKIILEQEERKKIEELNRLKSYFVSSVSHELRTPLTSIKMFAETLGVLGAKDTRKRKEYLEIIEGETERLSRLIENVLDFSKIERGVKEYNFSRINFPDVVLRAVRAMKYQFSMEGARLVAHVPKRISHVHADPDAIMEVVLNLLSNALKYSVGKKRVSLRTLEYNSSVVLEISDNGIGMSHTDAEKIFEPFFRVRNSEAAQVGGTGLGLALVKHIVDAHQGTISVKSKPGKGSIFRVEFPRDIDENRPTR